MNSQPAVADYLRRHGETGYRAFNLDVLHVEDGLIVEVTSFPPDLFGAFDRPQAP